MSFMHRSEKAAICLVLVAAFISGGQHACAAPMASAEITSQQVDSTTFRYDITLTDTGNTNVGTFWFAWVPGSGFLDSAPFNVQSPASWSDVLTNNNEAIQWVNSSVPLTPGGSLGGFQFDSHDTPSQVFGISNNFPGTPVGTSFVYIGAPLADPGFQFVAVPAPEPSGAMLTVTGLAGLAVWRWRRKTRRILNECRIT